MPRCRRHPGERAGDEACGYATRDIEPGPFNPEFQSKRTNHGQTLEAIGYKVKI